MRARLLPGLAILAGACLLPGPAAGQILQIPCRDPRGCPDLIVDGDKLAAHWHVEEHAFEEGDCALVEGCVDATGERQVLRFTISTPNVGIGDLIVGDTEDPENAPFFTDSICHRHKHFKDYSDYRLWAAEAFEEWNALREQSPDLLAAEVLAENPQLASGLVAGRKLGFCAIDIEPYPIPGVLTPPPPTYFDCLHNQGISVGYADAYHFTLDCQWIDVTDVPRGTYVLELEVNPERLFAEGDYSNNRAWISLELPDRQGRTPK